MLDLELTALIKKEGWKIVRNKITGQYLVKCFGRRFPVVHPVSIYLKLYKEELNPVLKYQYMKAAHDLLWPYTIWHYWTERRFRAHCEGYNFISEAGGANTTKSYDNAKIVLIFWFANPKGRRVVVASTTLESAEARIWGYVTSLLGQMDVILPFQYYGGKPPKIVNVINKETKLKDTRHGIYAVSAREGDDDKTIGTWIGIHPDEALMVVLDEGTEMPLALTKSIANLDASKKFFQLKVIGNSNSTSDLHGVLSTPKIGWENVNPMTMNQWETTQKNGICLFFNCYESPCIHETDPVKKKQMEPFLIDLPAIKEKEAQMGKDSESFWRFVIGFWQSSATESTIISKQFIEDFNIFRPTEWSGLFPLQMVGGLDPAFSTGGDKCILRLAILGVDTEGKVVLDFRENSLLFPIKIVARSPHSAEKQISDQVLGVLKQQRCPLQNVGIDCNGQGRALGGLLQSENRRLTGELNSPTKFYATRQGGNPVNSFDVVVTSSHELWFILRDYIEQGQIRGLDDMTIEQLTSRREIKVKDKTKKRQLESKSDYKTRMAAIGSSQAHSPDEADAATLCVQMAIRLFGFTPGQSRIVNEQMDADEKMYRIHLMQKAERDGINIKNHRPSLKADFSADITSLAIHKHPLA